MKKIIMVFLFSTILLSACTPETKNISTSKSSFTQQTAPLQPSNKDICGDNIIQLKNAKGQREECDGTNDVKCPGRCLPPGDELECTCDKGYCGDGIVQSPNKNKILEKCDGSDDANCPGRCIPSGELGECTCYKVNQAPWEICEKKCLSAIKRVKNLEDYVDYHCSNDGLCTVSINKNTKTKKEYIDQFSLSGFKIILRSEVDTPFLQGGQINFKITLEDFNDDVIRNLELRKINLLQKSEILAEISPSTTLSELDDSYIGKFTVTYDTKEMAELRIVILQVLYAYDKVSQVTEQQIDPETNKTINVKVEKITEVRETGKLSLATPLIVVNPDFVSDDMKVIK